MVYLQPSLYLLLQEGVLDPKGLKASEYIRDLILTDLRHRDLLSMDALESLLKAS